MCQRRQRVPRKPRVSKNIINAKCGKNAKSVKSGFKVRRWSLSVIVMLQNFQRLVSLLASQIQRHLLFHRSCSFSPSYFSSMRNCLSDASRLKLKRLRLVLTTKRATCVSQTTTSKLINRYLLVFEQTSGCEKKRQKVNRSEAHQWPNFERNDFVTLSNDGRQCFHVVRRPSRPN